MYLSVGGSNPPPSRFTVDSMTAQRDPNGEPVVLAQVHNTGGRAVDISGTLAAGPYHVQPAQPWAPANPNRSSPTVSQRPNRV